MQVFRNTNQTQLESTKSDIENSSYDQNYPQRSNKTIPPLRLKIGCLWKIKGYSRNIIKL